MTDYTAIRKLAEAAIDEENAYRRGEGRDPSALVAYRSAAGPEVFLDLLDRVLQTEARIKDQGACLEPVKEHDEMRERAEKAETKLADMKTDCFAKKTRLMEFSERCAEAVKTEGNRNDVR